MGRPASSWTWARKFRKRVKRTQSSGALNVDPSTRCGDFYLSTTGDLGMAAAAQADRSNERSRRTTRVSLTRTAPLAEPTESRA